MSHKLAKEGHGNAAGLQHSQRREQSNYPTVPKRSQSWKLEAKITSSGHLAKNKPD